MYMDICVYDVDIDTQLHARTSSHIERGISQAFHKQKRVKWPEEYMKWPEEYIH